MWQVTFLFLFRALVDLIESVPGSYKGVLNTAWMGLYQPPTAPIGPSATLAAITEANYDGYARQLVAWFTPIQSSAGPEIVYGQNLVFQPTDSLVPNTITGVFLADAIYGGALLMAAALPFPSIVLAGPQNATVIKPTFQLPTLQIYGGPVVES